MTAGVRAATRRVVWCTHAVAATIGKPMAISTSAPVNTQSGRPKPTTAALASTATTTKASA